MKIDANDPRWTAYALGEIADEKKRAEIESILAESEEMRQLVAEIRQTAGLVKEELAAEPFPGLTQAQRERIKARANVRRGWLPPRPIWIGAAAAMVLAISVMLVRFRHEEIASRQKSTEPILTAELKKPVQTADFMKQSREEVPAPEAAQRATAPAGLRADRALAVEPESGKEQSAPPAASVAAGSSHGAGLDAQKTAAVGDSFRNEVADRLATTAASPDRQKGQPVAPVKTGSPPEESLLARKAAAVPAPEGQKAQPVAEQMTATPAEQKALSDSVVVQAQALTNQYAATSPMQNVSGSAVVGGVSGELQGYFEDASMRRRFPPFPRPVPPFPPVPRPRGQFKTEAYDYIGDNPFLDVAQNPLSTFSIDVDTASYSNVRRFLDNGSLPPKDAVRIEELVNYFDYDYRGPSDEKPFAANFELSEAPWKPEHRLLRIGLKGREITPGKRPPGNLVFLLDVSGSMADGNKLPLVKESMRLLVDQLTESDRVAIVVYASDTRLLLPSTRGDQKEKLRRVIDSLRAGGSTNGASGIQLAYQTAQQNFIEGGTNRVILATDGDFNVGITSRGELARLIEEKAKTGIFLSALGFGMGNYKDATLELLATKGRGNYAYIDNSREAQKVLVEQINATLVAIAKDVKIQVEFNPRRVSSYRLIGYEDRIMPKEDFNDDEKTAGTVGAGHTVTVLYELVPAGISDSRREVDPLKYQKPGQTSPSADSDEILTMKIRSKEPGKDKSVLTEFTLKDSAEKFSKASQDFKFAAAVAAFGMALRDSPYKGNANLENALDWAKEGRGSDRNGYRQEFIRLIHRAISLPLETEKAPVRGEFQEP
jgi:Ca-activated chloride channel family protein